MDDDLDYPIIESPPMLCDCIPVVHKVSIDRMFSEQFERPGQRDFKTVAEERIAQTFGPGNYWSEDRITQKNDSTAITEIRLFDPRAFQIPHCIVVQDYGFIAAIPEKTSGLSVFSGHFYTDGPEIADIWITITPLRYPLAIHPKRISPEAVNDEVARLFFALVQSIKNVDRWRYRVPREFNQEGDPVNPFVASIIPLVRQIQ